MTGLVAGCGSSDGDSEVAKADALAASKSLYGETTRVTAVDHVGREVWRVRLVTSDGNRACFYVDLDKFVAHTTATTTTVDGLITVPC